MNVAMTKDAVMEETATRDDAVTGLLVSARAEAIVALAELHQMGHLSEAAADARTAPGYWLARLEGVILTLVAADDLDTGSTGGNDGSLEVTVEYVTEGRKEGGEEWITLSLMDSEEKTRKVYESLAEANEMRTRKMELRLVKRCSLTAETVLETTVVSPAE